MYFIWVVVNPDQCWPVWAEHCGLSIYNFFYVTDRKLTCLWPNHLTKLLQQVLLLLTEYLRMMHFKVMQLYILLNCCSELYNCAKNEVIITKNWECRYLHSTFKIHVWNKQEKKAGNVSRTWKEDNGYKEAMFGTTSNWVEQPINRNADMLVFLNKNLPSLWSLN